MDEFDEMGYSLSRLTLESDHFDHGNAALHGVGNAQTPNKPLHNLEHEVAQLTKLRSNPNERLTRIGPRGQDLPVSTVRMLAGREGNYSGRGGRFSSADRCHVLSRYLPVNGPWLVDQMSSRAYVSQFSADGSLFIAGFQDSHIRIYNVDRGWKVQKNIHAKSMRWTVTDTSLSPDQCHLVWDRRCLKTTGKPAGVLTGHLEGIAFIDSKGDGRYFISNGKDQTIKLWDIRKMSSSPTSNPRLRISEWDYRWMDYPSQAKDMKHPSDQSVATYRGHSVLRTLIRCYFSPAYSTGQKYIYTGSHNSSVYIYDLVSGAQVATLKHHKAPVRDCSWHPYYPMLVSSSWDGGVVRWEFPGNGEAPAPFPRKRVWRRHFY